MCTPGETNSNNIRKVILEGLCLNKRKVANDKGLIISCNNLSLIKLINNILY